MPRRRKSLSRSVTAEAVRAPGVLHDSVVVEVLNPKTALFFLTFLPQFVDATRAAPGLQRLVPCLSGSILIGLGGVLVMQSGLHL
ncbi:leucine export protein LeuE [compost metagenome]|uniref:hypothetical protein n=1 Tax=Pseudomonas vranovensis TaxID=321661 RepID=UPI000FBF3F5D|nr:hypothetical protein [Pseudomonas vranovensis]